ncbi:enoyl-CoA hydratase/isomerase family protein [Novosphingobium album (ex Hu et al. 2023)]|uniref:Enoyl-CoA hydratase/isomerase family protein n=1 Tax=Novosphingobium album (ex Hu et al. 2023) TaxID=2930093 RepID=A0ABT0B7L0_9SPHN|nr:enoyl-CoA hydratase/isomerase family protein [Novosphingobium album (ex Hu et al. 2023)]MCJ2181047.1 enoyl-CoA hydratase/isomerase family protein [Novosphingobium album (ex Hu et al. 2023)]
MTGQTITMETADRVATITIRRPEAKNALTKAMYAAIRDAVLAADADDGVACVVLRGSEGAFCVGGDLKEMLDAIETDPSRLMDYEEYLPFEAVRSLRKPSIASIDGLCIGGGLTMALMCDCLVATGRSRFAIPEAKVGIVDGHLPRLLREAVPPPRLRYWMYSGSLFSAQEAYEAGLLTKVVPSDDLDGTLERIVREFLASSPEAIRHLKTVLNETRPLSPMTDAYLTMTQPHTRKRLEAFAAR